ncbi:MAG TPA: hypothetical protein VGO97_05785 [Solirubrobacterales bacterium]|jgi:hypothetical protein|nr:hypothetical protein [Solirubrobacterales bacterium]
MPADNESVDRNKVRAASRAPTVAERDHVQYSSARTVAQVGGVALIASLFLNWYSLGFGDAAGLLGPGSAGILDGIEASFSGWKILKNTDIALVVVGAAAIAQLPLASAALMGRIYAIIGFLAAAFVLFRIISPPFDFLSLIGLEISPKPGIFLALAGAAAIGYAGWMQIKREMTRPIQTIVPSQSVTAQPAASPSAGYYGSPSPVSSVPVPPPDPFAVQPPRPDHRTLG